LAAHREERRSVVDLAQAKRITWLAQRNEPHSERLRCQQLALSFGARAGPRRPGGAATKGEIGQGVKGGARTAAMAQKIAKRARTNVLAADEPQPVEALGVAELTAFGRGAVHLDLSPCFPDCATRHNLRVA